MGDHLQIARSLQRVFYNYNAPSKGHLPALLRYVSNESGQITESYPKTSNACTFIPLNFGVWFGNLPKESRFWFTVNRLGAPLDFLFANSKLAYGHGPQTALTRYASSSKAVSVFETYRMMRIEAFKLLSRQKPWFPVPRMMSSPWQSSIGFQETPTICLSSIVQIGVLNKHYG